MMTAYQREYRKRRRAAGACKEPGCKHQAAPNRKSCEAHLAKARLYARQQRIAYLAGGLCLQCGKPNSTSIQLCSDCTAKEKAERVRRLTDGLCTVCGATATAREFCEEHWFRQLCATHKLGGKKAVPMLRRIWAQQNGICPLTGALLVHGDNASLDHIIPSSRGGKSVESNLQWVTRIANWMKRDMSVADFVAQCRAVVAHADAQQVHEEEELH